MSEEPKQEPEQPKKEKKAAPFSMVGLIAFVILLIAIVFSIILMLGVKSSVSELNNMIASGKFGKITLSENKDNESGKNEEGTTGSSVTNEKAEYFETGRITTNPRLSSNFVVLNLGMFFIPSQTEGEEAKAEEPKDKNSEPAFSPFGKKFDGMVKSIINSQIGNMSIQELQAPRDTINKQFLEKLKPLFQQQKAKLKEIAIVEFIIQ